MLLALSVAAVVARAVAAEEGVVARVVVEDAVEEVLVGLKSWRDGPSIESAVLFLQHLGWAVMGPEFGRGESYLLSARHVFLWDNPNCRTDTRTRSWLVQQICSGGAGSIAISQLAKNSLPNEENEIAWSNGSCQRAAIANDSPFSLDLLDLERFL